jgi:hypothetical protein
MIEPNVLSQMAGSRCPEPCQVEQDWVRVERTQQNWLRLEQDEQDYLRAEQVILARQQQ